MLSWYCGASVVFAAATAASFFWPAARAGLGATVLLAVVLACAVGAGRAILGRMGLPGLEEAEKIVAGATLGLGALALAVFALAALRLLSSASVAAVLGGLWLAGYPELRAAAAAAAWPEDWRRRPLAAGGVLAVLGALFWLCWVPPHQYDSLVYHLALPRAYLHAGGFTVSGQTVFAHFPQNGEMLFTLALALGSDLLAQMLMFGATALSAAWIWTAPRELPAGTRVIACLLLVTHTAVMLLSSTTYVEPLAMLWTTAAALSFWRWLSAADDPSGAPGRGRLALSAVFTGLALGTKYTAGGLAGVLGLMLLARCAAAPRLRRRWADLALFAGLAAAVFLPWLAKNAWTIGNPVFPFLYEVFPSTRSGWPAEGARRYFQVLTEYGFGGPWWLALAKLPAQLLGNSLRFGGGMDVLGDMGWELCFWCLPPAAWFARRSRPARWLLVFCALYLAVWFCTGVVLRFLTVLAPLLCLAAAGGLHGLWTHGGPRARRALLGAAGLLTATHVLVFLFAHSVFGSAAVLWGAEDRETFLSKRLEYYPCAAWTRDHSAGNDKILVVGEQRSYYAGQPCVATTVNAPNPFLAWADEAADPAAYARRLAAEGFSHVLLVPREARRLAPQLDVSERAYANWAGLVPGHAEAVFQGPACSVYRLKP
ncbi:MAG: hypothetical protein PHF00_14125 [Elusimicrobia bacterium]|nr:hypothetical protein [Elusimicrobiota bacterium]